MASQGWSKWQDMNSELWRDRYFSQVQLIGNKTAELPQRLQTIQDLGVSWSNSIKFILQKIIKDANEPTPLKEAALKRLKQRPSLDNFKAMIIALRKTDNSDFLTQLTQTLRIRNPKGPVFNEDLSLDQKEKMIKEWEKWWKSVEE